MKAFVVYREEGPEIIGVTFSFEDGVVMGAKHISDDPKLYDMNYLKQIGFIAKLDGNHIYITETEVDGKKLQCELRGKKLGRVLK